ncbi:aminotransferase class V-fold PLP-dependent enzyme [Serratia sp. 2723]|uniref:aminotransferase class V-fold PLP-dependent enzyme n=1 Tax=unclassified Serratia (in: enterobacteria) TaxID=2647522 RepID=UPI003D222046
MLNNFDNQSFRAQFPAIDKLGMIYLDSAATALKPLKMIEAISRYTIENGATVHRSLHSVGKSTTELYEQARYNVCSLINGASIDNVIWTDGTTASMNIIAHGYLRNVLNPGDEILINDSEHHSNIVPWIQIANEMNATLVRIPLNKNGSIKIDALESLINKKTKFIAITQMSNVTGFMPDIDYIISVAHRYGVKVSVDGAQGIVHNPIDVQKTKVDFYSFSAHKLYGPNGVGVLYYSPAVSRDFSPFYGGGQMLSDISGNEISFKKSPFCFEPGTPNIMGILGFGATLEWLKTYNFDDMSKYSSYLSRLARSELEEKIPGFICFSDDDSSILSFNIKNIHHVDFATLLSEYGLLLRSGKHCAIPLMKHFSISGTLRASFSPYNNESDVEKLVSAIIDINKDFG